MCPNSLVAVWLPFFESQRENRGILRKSPSSTYLWGLILTNDIYEATENNSSSCAGKCVKRISMKIFR